MNLKLPANNPTEVPKISASLEWKYQKAVFNYELQ